MKYFIVIMFRAVVVFEEDKVYLTPEGKEKLEEELRTLERLKESKLSQKELTVHFGAVEAEFFALQEDLHALEARIEEIRDILRNAVLITPPPEKEREKVTLGATVEVEVNGNRAVYKLVDSFEADPMAGKLSVRSPVGRALLGKKVGDEATVNSAIKVTYKIIGIKYE